MVALDQTPPPTSSAFVRLHRKRLAHSPITPQPAAKVSRSSVGIMHNGDHKDAASSAYASASSASSASKPGEYGASKQRDKGKGKAKMTYLPELPEEVWRRIFQIHYSDVVDEWQHTDRLRMALTPLLIGPDLYRVALPILYVHPVVSYKTIPAFARSVSEPSLYLNGDFPKSCLVRHLTVRPSPIVPSAELPKKAHGAAGSAQATSYTIHPLLKDALSPFRDLQSFTLKEAMILHQPDAAVLFSALSLIAPKKARLEFRMWDLNDSSLGEELLSMTRASSYSSLARYANRASETTVGDRNNRAGHDTYRQPLLEAWRDALLKGTEFEAPTWWLEGPGDNNNGNGAAGQIPAVAHAGPATLVPPPMPPPFIGPPPGPQIPNAARFEHVDPLGEVERRSMYFAAYRESIGEPIEDLRARDTGRDAHLWPIPQSRHSPEMRSAMPSVGPSSNDEDAFSNPSTPGSPRPAHTQVQAAHNPIGGLRSEEQETSERTDETVADSSAAWHSHIAASASQSQALRGASRGTLPSVIPDHRTPTNVPRVLPEGLFRGSVPPPRPRSPRNGAEHSRLRRRMPHLDHTPFVAHPSPAAGVEGSERSSLSTHDAGMTLHPLAHRVREQLRELVGRWTPALQALSIVAFDPLSTLIVRAPQLDFWPSVAVPHIRVQLPRACHALGIFQGTREAARARQRRREAEEGQITNPIQQALAQVQALALLQGQSPPSTLTPAQLQVLSAAQYEEERLVGGDGNGGGLVNEDVKLFEIEVNTRSEMGDDVWIRYGHQLPPQVCRILAGAPEHNWTSVRLDDSARNSPPYARSEGLERHRSQSPATLGSPAFSFVSFESDDEDDGLSATGSLGDSAAGATYDAEAAEAQLIRTEERRRRAARLSKHHE